jgi:hypothetical protein
MPLLYRWLRLTPERSDDDSNYEVSVGLVVDRCDTKAGGRRHLTRLSHTGPERGKLSRSFASIVLPDLRLVVQDHVQQRVTDFQFAVVFDIAQFAKFVHEMADT